MVMQLEGLRAVIYTRKSTVSDGKSTRDQERENRNWCDANGIPVEKVFCDEGVSASRYGKKARGAWADLKSYLRPGHILVAWEASRATRDAAEGAAFIDMCAELGIPLAYSGRVLDLTSGDDRFVGGLDFLLAARESDKIKERVSRGIRGAIADGTPHARPPWGYRSLPRMSGTAAQWEADPVEAPRVRRAVERLLSGESQISVFNWLRSTGRSPASPSSLRRVLLNPQLAGLRVHKGEVTGRGTWPAVLTEEEHRQLVARSKSFYTPPGPEPNNLCTGIAKCGKCGKGLRFKIAHPSRNRKPMYACPQGCTSRLAETVDTLVEKAIMRRLLRNNPNDYDTADPQVAAALKRIEELEADLAGWEEKALNEECSAEMYAKVEKDRKRKIAELRPRTVLASQKLLTAESWPGGTLREQRETIRSLLTIKLPAMRPGQVDITPKWT